MRGHNTQLMDKVTTQPPLSSLCPGKQEQSPPSPGHAGHAGRDTHRRHRLRTEIRIRTVHRVGQTYRQLL